MSDKSSRLLGVFAKYWQPGQVKTRLASSIGPNEAARIYRQFILHLTCNLSQSGENRAVYFWPPNQQSEFESLVPKEWFFYPQVEGGLGARMRSFFQDAFGKGHSSVVLIGTDSPWISPSLIEQAFEALAKHQVVFGPSTDGGYYLIGMREFLPVIFEGVDWSTDKVVEQTINQLQTHNLSWAELEKGYDIDTLDDLKILRRQLKEIDARSELESTLLQTVEQNLKEINLP